jgi:membrane protease YdiL (CAAX protease family)
LTQNRLLRLLCKLFKMTKTLIFFLGIVVLYYLWLLLRFILFSRKFCRPQDKLTEMLYLRFSGVLILGGGGIWWAKHKLGMSIADVGLKFSQHDIDWKWLIIAASLILIMAFVQRRQNRMLWEYPVIRAKRWSWALVMVSALSWALYLLAFETFFRGVFFLGMNQLVQIKPVFLAAICAIVYAIMYASAHFYEDLRIIGLALVFAFAMYLIVHATGSIFTAVLIHIFNAWIFEWFTLYKHPEIKVRGLFKPF